MNQQQEQTQAEYMNALLDRLVEHYLSTGARSHQEGERLTPDLFHKLCRAIMAEGYGR